MLRANDLIWSFVVNNYLMGNEPFPFDLLYWNSDATRMPARMHSYYLRTCIRKTSSPNRTPWSSPATPSTFRKSRSPPTSCPPERTISPLAQHLPRRQTARRQKPFRPGRIRPHRGVVNPPDGGKYNHWVNDRLPEDAAAWLEGAAEMAGSWWPDWNRWSTAHAPARVPARVPGSGKLQVIEDAPGSYVKVKS